MSRFRFSIRYTEDSSSDRFNSSSSEPESDFYRSRQSTGSVSSYALAPALAPAHAPPPVPIMSPPTPPPPKEFQWAKADGQWTKEPISNAENSEPKVGDVRFEERSLFVTKEDLEAEIPSGAALARIAAFKQMEQAATQSGASGTLPRSRAVTPTRKILDSFQNGTETQQKPVNAVQQRQSMPAQSGNSWPRNATAANGGDPRRQSTPPKTNGFTPGKPVNGAVPNGLVQKALENRPKTPTASRWGPPSPQPAANHISPPVPKSIGQPVKPIQPVSVKVDGNAAPGQPVNNVQSPAKPAASPSAMNGWAKPVQNAVAPQNARVVPQPVKNIQPISVQVNNSPQNQRSSATVPSPSKLSASPNIVRNGDIKPISVQVSSPSQAMRPPSSTPPPSMPPASPSNGQKGDVKQTPNSSTGPYRFQKNNSPGLSPQLGSPQLTANNAPRPYQSSLSPVSPKQNGPVSPASSTSSFRSSGSTPSTASSSLSMTTADERRGRGQSHQPRAGSSSGIGTASSSSASSLSPPLRSASSSPMAKPTVVQAPSTSASGPPPTPVEGPCPPAGAFRRMFHLRAGTAGTEHNANFERLRQSFSKNGDSPAASATPASPGPLRKSASCVDAVRNGDAADSTSLPKSGEAIWKTAATAKKMHQQQSAAKSTDGNATQPVRPASVTPVPIKAPWYRKENYEGAEPANNGTSAAKPTPIAIKLNRSGTSGGSGQAQQPPVSQQQLGKLEKMDPLALRSNYKFAINLNDDAPINIVRR